ncbi:MAG TPA: DUF6029 family protein [Saprospiraceae bacterium]|nr:DUF6029 family protein [Saprospiraceae bacterium]HRG65641.1 DUF6029 family protein [Saprospiraceae bacterium]
MLRQFVLPLLFFIPLIVSAQQGAVISGALQVNANVFLKDSAINAYLQPQYQHQFFGGESWLNLNYSYQGFTAGLRYDMFLNSNLRDPNASYTNQGVGRWFVKKTFDKFTAEVGYLYDQVGSGIIYRAYEQRPLFIDNSLLGASLKYQFSDALTVRAFGGQQKNAFDIYTGSVKGVVADGFFSFGSEENAINLIPGIGFIHKTISEETMEKVVNGVKTYLDIDRFKPKYNSYAATFYNTLNYKGFNWYVEAAIKSDDVFFNPRAEKQEFGGGTTFGKLEFKPGSVYYTSLSYSAGKLGITLEAKRTKNFNFRIDPNLRLLRGLISYIPPMNRQNTYRLTARYSPATQDISEQAYQADVRYKFTDKWSTLVNFSHINTLEGEKLFREFLTEVTYKANTKMQITGGLQLLNYNQEIYEQKPDVPIVETVTPYVDVLYKFTRKKSLRTEVQYMKTDQDYGSWLFGLAEFGMAPNWIFEVSGMYNIVPKKILGNDTEPKKVLYPSLGAVYIKGSNRYQLRYVKQVEGVVCSGGICRLEPAFSGVRFSLNSTF